MNLPVGAVHHIPGRIRIRLPFLKRNAEGLDQIKSFLDRVDGVHYVKPNSLTGSILIFYEPGQYDAIFDRVADTVRDNFGLLIAAAPKLLETDPAAALRPYTFDPSKPSKASAELSRAFRGVDRWLRSASENSVDIRTAVPLGLAAAALLRFGAATTPLWVALAIASFASFVAMNPNALPGNGNHEDTDSESPRDTRELIKEVMSPNA